jgi:hypothetical protein
MAAQTFAAATADFTILVNTAMSQMGVPHDDLVRAIGEFVTAYGPLLEIQHVDPSLSPLAVISLIRARLHGSAAVQAHVR